MIREFRRQTQVRIAAEFLKQLTLIGLRQRVVECFCGRRFFDSPSELIDQLLNLEIDLGLSPSLEATGVGLNVSAIGSDSGQPGQPCGEGDSDDALEEMFERLFEVRAKLAEGGVIGPMPFSEPHEVETVRGHVFELATGPDASSNAIEPKGGEDSGMNGRLPERTVIGGFPFRPVISLSEFRIDASGMIVRDDFIELGWKQDNLLACQRGLGPISIFHAHLPEFDASGGNIHAFIY